jgi:hypothetical protein
MDSWPDWAIGQYPPSLNILLIRHSETLIIGGTSLAMISSSQIRSQLARFLDKRIDLDTFEDWFVQNTWNVHQSGSVAAEQLTFAIEEVLSEYSSLCINESLRTELSKILAAENIMAEIVNQPQIVYVFKSSPSILVPLTL